MQNKKTAVAAIAAVANRSRFYDNYDKLKHTIYNICILYNYI